MQIAADIRRIMDDVDAKLLQFGARADTGELQQLRRLERAAARQHFALGVDVLRWLAGTGGKLDPERLLILDQNAMRVRRSRSPSRFGRPTTGRR